MTGTLSGVSVLVAGAGLAGLAAARDLSALGAVVTIAEAGARVGGRVRTVRDGFADGQHAEAGGDLIDQSHVELRRLAADLGLRLVPVLKSGWASVTFRGGRARIERAASGGRDGWSRLATALVPLVDAYRLAEKCWDSPIAADLGTQTVADWLDGIHADETLRLTATGLRGFFLADPHELSLLALVDQFASDEDLTRQRAYRIVGGNDRLAAALARPLGSRLHLETELVSLRCRPRSVQAGLSAHGRVAHASFDYVVCAVPAPLLRRIEVSPAWPTPLAAALETLRYGRATKTLIQYSRRFWHGRGRPSAFGSSATCGAIWDGNEEQRGPAGILTLLAGGSASDETHDLIDKGGVEALERTLAWMMRPSGARRLGWHQIRWAREPYAQGGYAYFSPGFSPSLRSHLARPYGRLFFAGEHTSVAWQGYMNGAVQSGRRAAAEVAATHRMPRPAGHPAETDF